MLFLFLLLLDWADFREILLPVCGQQRDSLNIIQLNEGSFFIFFPIAFSGF